MVYRYVGIQHIYEIHLLKRKKSAVCYNLSDIGENEINQMQKDKYVEFRYLESKIVKAIEAGSRMLETWGREKWGDVGKGVQNFSLCKVNQFWRLMYKNVTMVNHIILYIWNLLTRQILSIFTKFLNMRIIAPTLQMIKQRYI